MRETILMLIFAIIVSLAIVAVSSIIVMEPRLSFVVIAYLVFTGIHKANKLGD